jgi:hypothetical protein
VSNPKRILTVSVIDDGESVRLTVCQEDLIGQTLVAVFGQSRDAISLPVSDVEQWRRDMAVWLLEEL